MRKDLGCSAGALALCLMLTGAVGCGDDKGGLSGSEGDLKHRHGKDAAVPAPVDAAAPAPVDAAAPMGKDASSDQGAAPSSCAAVLCKTGTTCVEGATGATCVEPTGPGCAATQCETGSHCELHEVQCIRAPCPPQPTCVVDVDPCAAARCQAGTHCESRVVQCFAAPCPPVTECVAN